MKISIIIPTKNRPIDLKNCLFSIRNQTYLPSQIIIVDQSNNSLSPSYLKSVFDHGCNIKIDYVYDKSIDGLVHAKAVGVKVADCELVCFLEDDVVLQYDYLENIKNGFISNPSMIGSSGVITNYPKASTLQDILFSISHIGIFRDIRFSVYKNYLKYKTTLVSSDKLSGGVSAWRSKIFDQIPFDLQNKFHYYEDIEFSIRVNDAYPNCLSINTQARLEHYYASPNRLNLFNRYKNQIRESIFFYRKRKWVSGSSFDIAILLLGVFFKCFVKSIHSQSISPLKAYGSGMWDGFSSKINY